MHRFRLGYDAGRKGWQICRCRGFWRMHAELPISRYARFCTSTLCKTPKPDFCNHYLGFASLRRKGPPAKPRTQGGPLLTASTASPNNRASRGSRRVGPMRWNPTLTYLAMIWLRGTHNCWTKLVLTSLKHQPGATKTSKCKHPDHQ